MYINHRSRVYGVLHIYHVPVLDPIAYGNAYSTLLHHIFLCVDHKMATLATGCYYKTFSHICAQHQHHSEHDINFLSNFIYLPFLFDLINKSMFACPTRQVFLKLSVQTIIGCMGSSVHYYLCVINFCTCKLQS